MAGNEHEIQAFDLTHEDLRRWLRCDHMAASVVESPNENQPAIESKCEKNEPSAFEVKTWLFEQRISYAKDFFDHHAKQRMQMFQFFLVFAGLVVSGYGALLSKDYGIAAVFVAVSGTILTIFFVFLERRNRGTGAHQ